MPTSYSTLLGLALPVTGELSGTWGDEVNNYITQYLDSAVAGTQTISGSQTAVTLSRTTNAALSQAGSGSTGSSQYQVINCTGNPASALTVTVPSTSKVYLVLNNTSTSQTVTVKGAATTGVTVAAARCALIAWNGTDFELVATDDASKMNGVLAVANGGTGLSSGTSGGVPYFSGTTTIASSAALSANALVVGGGAGAAPSTVTTGTGVVTALGVNTGSAGAFVVNGGALGTPSSGTVTNLTGTASININGTVGATTANTGAFTSITSTSASGILTRAAATQDGVELIGRAGGTTSLKATITPTTLTASRTFTLPDVTGTVVTTGDTGTVTNTMLAGSIANNKLANSTISGVALGSNLNTLTMNVSGTGLSGSTTYNGSAAATFTVTSNATSANTASTVVARDASGNFSAGTITAALSGNATTATSAGNLTGGTISGNYIVGNSTSPNTFYLQFGDSSGWIYRFMTSVSGTPTTRFSFVDNGNFTAVGTVTGSSFSGAGTGLTGTASSLSIGGTASNVSGVVAVANGGTGLSSTPANGALDIGNGTGFTRATLTAGSGVSISNGSGSITISATGSGGTVTGVTATSPVASSGGTAPVISLNSAYGDTLNPYGSKTANFFLAAPNGSAGAPTFRAIVAADIPTLNQNTTGTASNVTGTVAVANGGTGSTTAAGARTNLGATTVGSNLFTLTNPSAVTFPRFNADNTVSALDAATFRSAIGAGTGNGTVTSVATSGSVNGITLTGGTITSTGTITLGGTLSGVSLTTQVSGTLPVANGGTGITSFGSGVATWLGTPSSANLAAAVTDETGSGSLVFATSPTLVTPNIGTPSAGNLTNTTVDGTNKVGYRNLPAVGTKTASYTLAVGDVGKYVQLSTGGSITIPTSTFAEGDAITLYNNTTGNITITCSAPTAYIAGTNTVKTSMTLATRGVATILFYSATACVVSGNVS